ncbi:hypothetical protein Tco_0612364 [Tanacetum coccineum]
MTTLNEPSPQGLGSGSGPRRQDTTLGGADAQTRFETASKKSHDPPLSEGNTSGSGEDSMEHQVDLTDFVPPTPHDSPLSGGHTPGSDEGRPNFNELINLCTQLSNRVLALENSKTAQDLVIQKLKKRVKRLEKALRARTLGMKLFKIGTSRRKGLDKENHVYLRLFPATPGNTSPDFSNDLTKYLLATLVFSPLHDDPYMEIMQEYDATNNELPIPPLQAPIAPPTIVSSSPVLSLSPMFNSRDLFPPEEI